MQPARTRQAPERTRFSPEQALFAAAAVILILGSQMSIASYLTPKNGLGYGLGIVGGVMLLLQSLYAVRKRMPSLAFLGSVPAWFQWHVLLGVIAPVVILLHCGFSLGATNSNIALFSMLLVAGAASSAVTSIRQSIAGFMIAGFMDAALPFRTCNAAPTRSRSAEASF